MIFKRRKQRRKRYTGRNDRQPLEPCRIEERWRRGRLRKLYSRIHGHGGEFGVDFSAGRFGRVTGKLLRRVQLVPSAEVQRRRAVVLANLMQVGLGGDHHTRSLAVHEVFLWKQKNYIN